MKPHWFPMYPKTLKETKNRGKRMTISLAYATASGIDWLCNLSLALTTCEHRGSWRCCTYIYIPPLGITCRGWAWHFIAITCTVISQPLWPQCTTIKWIHAQAHPTENTLKTGAQGGPSNCASKSRSQNEAPIKCKTWPGSRFLHAFFWPKGVESATSLADFGQNVCF